MSQKDKYINSPLRGFKYADEEFKNNFLKTNEQALKKAKSNLSEDEYDKFFTTLYNYNLYNVSGMNATNPEIGKSQQSLNDYFNKQANDLNFAIENAPDFDDNNNYIDDDNTYTPEMWDVYNNLDDLGKEEFVKSVKKRKDLKAENDEGKHLINGALIKSAGVLFKSDALMQDAENYYKRNVDFDKNAVNEANAETLETIKQNFYNRLTDNADFKEATLNNSKKLIDLFTEGSENSNDTENKISDAFIKAMKQNRILAGASGNGGVSFKETADDLEIEKLYDKYKDELDNTEDPVRRTELQSLVDKYKNDAERIKSTREYRSNAFERLMEDNPEFKIEYLSKAKTLSDMVEDGTLTEEGYHEALENIAEHALADKSKWYEKLYHNVKGVGVTASTYMIQKVAAVGVHAYQRLTSDGSVFMNNNGKIFADNDVLNMGTKRDDGSYDVYTDSNNNIVPNEGIVVGYDNKPVTDDAGNYYIKIDSRGNYINGGNVDDLQQHPERYKKVSLQNIKDTQLGTGAVYSLGYFDDGTEIPVALNPKYISLASQYNVLPTDKDELDYYNKFGYSPSVGFTHPGDSKRNFVGEVMKMCGFTISDMLFQATIGRIPVVGSALNSATSTLAIAEAYRQGVFEESYNSNVAQLNQKKEGELKESLDNYMAEHSEELEQYIDQSIKDAKSKNPDIEFNDATLQNIRNLATARFKNDVYRSLENEYDASNDRNTEYKKAAEAASMAADADFIGEAMKYAAVNYFGHRAWLFKKKAVANANTRQLFGDMVGKRLEKWGTATAEDVAAAESKAAKLTAERDKLIDRLKNSTKSKADIDKGIKDISDRYAERINRLPKKVGDSFVSNNWDTMSVKQKVGMVGKNLLSQAWGGGWTNFTDEMQSRSSKALNDALFETSVANSDSDGVSAGLLFNANVIASQYNAFINSVYDFNTQMAGGVGAAGAVLGSPNITGIMHTALTSRGREQWRNMSDVEKLHTIWASGITADLSEKISNDREAGKIIAFTDKIIDQTAKSKASMFKVLGLGALASSESSYAKSVENDIESLANTILSTNDFIENNEVVASQDIAESITKFKSDIEQLIDIDNQDENTRNALIEQIKVFNPSMSTEEAAEELNNVVKKAKAAKELIDSSEKLFNSKEFKRERDLDKKNSMYRNTVLKFKNDYILNEINDIESKISGNKLDDTSIQQALNGDIFNDTQSLPVTTLKARHNALNYVLNNTLLKEKKSLEKQIKELQGKEGKNWKETNEISHNYEAAKFKLATVESDIEELQSQISEWDKAYEKRKASKEKTGADTASYIPAENILKLNPLVRMIYFDKDNERLFTRRQVKEIKRARTILKDNGVNEEHLDAVPVMIQRYSNRSKEIAAREEAMNNGDNVDFTEEYNIANALAKVKTIVDQSIVSELLNKKKSIRANNVDKDSHKNALTSLYKNYNAAKLNLFKNRNEFADDSDIIDEVKELRTVGESVARTIAIKKGAGELSDEEAATLNNINNSVYGIAVTKQEYLDKMSEFASKSESFAELFKEATGVIVNSKATVDTTTNPAEKDGAAERAEKAEMEAAEIMNDTPEETKSAEVTPVSESTDNNSKEFPEPVNPSTDSNDKTTFPTPTTEKVTVTEPSPKKESVDISNDNPFREAKTFQELADSYVDLFMKTYPGIMDAHPDNVKAIKTAFAKSLETSDKPSKDFYEMTMGKKDENPLYKGRMDFSKITQQDFISFLTKNGEYLKEAADFLKKSQATPGEVNEDSTGAHEKSTPSGKEESPENLKSLTDILKESFIIPGEGIPTSLPQTEEVTDSRAADAINIVNKADSNKFKELEQLDSCLKGNVMSTYDLSEANRGREVIKTPNSPTSTMARYFNWMSANKRNLQRFIDEKLVDVLNSKADGEPLDLKIMLTTKENNAYGDNTVIQNRFLVTEYTSDVAKVYTEKDFEKYGEPIESDSEGESKKYIIVGVLGWAGTNPNQRASVVDNIDPIIYGSRDAYFSKAENKQKRFFVMPGMHTNVRQVKAGYMSLVQNNMDVNILDLIADKESNNSNPYNYTLNTLEFGIQLDENNFLMCNDELQNDVTYVRPAKYKKNTGAVYVFVKGGNGKNFPRKIAPTVAVDLIDGSKMKNDINTALDELKSLDFETRKNAWKKLAGMLVMDNNNKVSFGDEDKPWITFTKNGSKQVFKLSERDKWTDDDFNKAFYDLHLLVSITKRNLENLSTRKMLAEAGAIKVNTNKLGTFNSDFVVYNINTSTGEPIITNTPNRAVSESQPVTVNSNQVIQNNVSYRVYEDSTVQGGIRITDAYGNNVDNDTWNSVYYGHMINKFGFTPNEFFTEKGKYKYYTVMIGDNGGVPTVIQQDVVTEKIVNITDTDKGISIYNTIMSNTISNQEQADIDARNAAAQEMLDAIVFDDVEEPAAKPEPVEVNTVTAVSDLLEENKNVTADTQRAEVQTPASPLPVPVKETVTPETTKPDGSGRNLSEILENDSDLSIITALDDVIHFNDSDTLEDMLEKCRQRGIPTENITDINSWLESLKC